ncbi:MAG TPA: bacillithiol system redox-active protein YtxJ [Saprospiraceae bacterium]|nr:bacillithiol system redox-active protein YtxJ [Saprospiraceae bacterium]HMQ81835.1 bacillithiol system redox-active protein YtxJ [Saprospiraceae bacterium]
MSKIIWKFLTDIKQVDELVEQSHQQRSLIFKHSTRCPVSALAKNRLESKWDFGEEEFAPYFLDLIAHRQVSNYIADKFGVAHESPQVLLIHDGACTYHASHLDIEIGRLRHERSVSH